MGVLVCGCVDVWDVADGGSLATGTCGCVGDVGFGFRPVLRSQAVGVGGRDEEGVLRLPAHLLARREIELHERLRADGKRRQTPVVRRQFRQKSRRV